MGQGNARKASRQFAYSTVVGRCGRYRQHNAFEGFNRQSATANLTVAGFTGHMKGIGKRRLDRWH